MSSVAQSILIASQQYTIYVSFIILFSGVFGHIFNILIFTHLKIFRGNPSAIYLISESIVNLFQMLISFSSRIAINGFNNDLTQTSIVWCKLRNAFVPTFTLISLSIVCFAAIDQYLSTNHYPYLRQMSTTKTAKNLITLAIIIWCLHSLPLLILFEIRPIAGCNIYNQGMITYVTYVYYLILTGALPIAISTLFGILAYQNVRRIVRQQIAVRRRKLDQQLTAMIIVRVGFLVVLTVPYVLQRIYSNVVYISKEDVIHKAVLQLVGSVTISLFYLNYSGSFYLFLISSGRFRRQVKNVFLHKFWRIYCRNRIRQNQILPLPTVSSGAFDLQSIN
ncbi:unnamed protein product [Adineta steineri]|uniref:G-protein coupled receptors family 1 profile domain-containing protein n=1 Tax=Adineta steineri TaxID=433720 RepID=A0A815DWI7_9BILA|nr:unnamed protein product [Adineta steineri]CAF1230157.1 unnamed protein product [Adineta steineri]CAF1302114.1 unnamed protein product [Adineta steineri]